MDHAIAIYRRLGFRPMPRRLYVSGAGLATSVFVVFVFLAPFARANARRTWIAASRREHGSIAGTWILRRMR
jgi:ribosomal protein S18 acetylase RimI-like enzyme